MHQFKINAKAAFNGDVWQWHQDFGTWHRDDEMLNPCAMNIALFLEDVTEFNGALMFIPRSHKAGVIEAGHDLKTTSYPLWTIDDETITRLVDEGGIIAPKGKAGSVIMFNSIWCTVHPAICRPTIVRSFICRYAMSTTTFGASNAPNGSRIGISSRLNACRRLPQSRRRGRGGMTRRTLHLPDRLRTHDACSSISATRRREPTRSRWRDRRRQVWLDVFSAGPSHTRYARHGPCGTITGTRAGRVAPRLLA